MGGTSSAHIQTKDILIEAIKRGAPKIIIVHNHPSGDSTPSTQDCKFTKQIEQSAEILGVQLLDHVVIGDNQYTSIKAYMLKEERKSKTL